MDPKESITSPSRVSSDFDYHNEHETLFGLRKEAKNRKPRYLTIFLVLALLLSNGAWLWYGKYSFWLSSQRETQCKYPAQYINLLVVHAD
jgi:hypothetical protein